MKCKNNDMARRVRIVKAYPAFSIALVVSAALTLTPFAPSALAATTTPPDTTTTASPTSTPTAAPTTAPPTAPAAAPSAAPSAAPTAAPGSTAAATTSPAAVPNGSPAIVTTGGAPVDHHVLARIEDSTLEARYLSVDAPMPDASQFQTIRVRFTMHNTGTGPITAAPQLEYRPSGSSSYTLVPEEAMKGIPLHVVREWVPSPGGGTTQGPPSADIAVADLLTGREGGRLALIGHHSMGANPDRPITLPTGSYTEQEFSIRLTMDAGYLTGYDLRITDGKAVLAGAQTAKILLGRPPALRLSPGQHQGLSVDGPKQAGRTGVVR